MRLILPIVAALTITMAGLVSTTAHAAAETVTTTRLYTLDCGHFVSKSMAPFSDTGEYNGRPGELADPCFVIRHPKGTLIWDTGLGDALAATPGGVDADANDHISMPVTLAEQLKAIGLTPVNITYVAFSHFHFDHTGNANLFPDANWIVNRKELDWALQPGSEGADPKTFSGYKTAKTTMIDGDHDVFGDGSVMILRAPGHTPGHQVLQIKLKKSGTVILSGDLYHTLANRQFKRVPAFNTNRADTLASIDRIEKIVDNTHARFVVQHAPEDFAKLPKFPAYLD